MNKEGFNVGDIVLLIYPNGVHTLELNKQYIIIEIKVEFNGELMLALDGVLDDDNPYYYNSMGNMIMNYRLYNSKRFIKDIRILRKKKLDKIYGNC